MVLYLVERHLPGITGEQLTAAAQAAKDTTATMRDEGTQVRYLRSTFLPAEEKVMCLFEASSMEPVKEANERAHIPFDRILEAAHIAADDLA